MLARFRLSRHLLSGTASSSSSSSYSELVAAISSKLESKRAILEKLKSTHGTHVLGNSTVASVTGGMRGLTCLLCETSQLIHDKGITYRGYELSEVLERLPRPNGSKEPLVEGVMWLLLTGDMPTKAQAMGLTHELQSRAQLPDFMWKAMDAIPKDTHPMTQLCAFSAMLSRCSKFSEAYNKGTPKSEMWKSLLDDAFSLLAMIPMVASHIYRKSFGDGNIIAPDNSLDWGANYAHLMGFDSAEHAELMRLYLTLHADHGAGNVSAHASNLVASALSDPFLAYTASMSGLAGPLHGRANQDCLKWLLQVQKEIGSQPVTCELIKTIAQKTLAEGRVIPGYGHAVLRVTDPRFLAQHEFASRHIPNSQLYKILEVCKDCIPQVLMESGKVSNPHPNVDAYSGALLYEFGIREANYYTVLFGVSRAIGALSQMVWLRILGYPIERPRSISLDRIIRRVESEKSLNN